MRNYSCLKKSSIQQGDYSLVPIRDEDQLLIMKWRNEQIYHLRQAKELTKEDQQNYFETVVSSLFNQSQPSQILFSLLEKEECIGYGGLVHINWIDKHAEISFIMNTALEQLHFHSIWSEYLKMIEQVAFDQLQFHKLFVYAYDLRPHLYQMLLKNGYFLDARLKDHCRFEGRYIDVVIHSKLNQK